MKHHISNSQINSGIKCHTVKSDDEKVTFYKKENSDNVMIRLTDYLGRIHYEFVNTSELKEMVEEIIK